MVMSNKNYPKNFFVSVNENSKSHFLSATAKSCGAAAIIFLTLLTAAAQQTTTPTNPQQQQTNPAQTQTQTQTQQQNPQTQTPQQIQPQQQAPVTQTPATPTVASPQSGGTNVNTPTTTTVPNGTTQTPNQSVGTSGIAPAVLPDDPPPIAPNFQAPLRPLPSAERVGVDVSDQLPLSLQEAITLALQNNNDIAAAKSDVRMAEFDLRAARGVYDPVISTQNYYQRQTTPTASTIGGATNGSITQSNFLNDVSTSGFTPVAGGAYRADFSTSRLVTNSQNATLNPQFPSALTLTYTQPLWRGLRFDNNRRTIAIAKKNLSLTDAQFRQRAIETIAQVEQAYWDLAFALRNLQVQIDAVRQARQQLESNQRLVSKGVLAPIDIIAANTQITTFEQNIYTAQESVTRSENVLKTLMLPDRASDIWKRALVPVSPVELDIPKVPLDQAVTDALANRQELAQLKTNDEINQINERYFRDQTKPQINLVGTYTGNGLAGTPTIRTGSTAGTTSLLVNRVNDLSALAGLSPLTATTTSSTVTSDLIGGYGQSLLNVATARFPTYQIGVAISLPIGNRTAKANLGKSLVEADKIKSQRAQQEQAIEADVRNSLQSLRSAEARLQAAAASRASAEQLFESEQRQFKAGTTTVFLVLQRQTELVVARGNELQAQTALNKAVSNFQRSTGTTLSANSVEISRDGTRDFIFGRPTEFGSRIFTAKNKDFDEK